MATADTLSLQIIVDAKTGQVTVKNLRQEIEQTTTSFNKAGKEAKEAGNKMQGVWKQMLGGQIAFASIQKGYRAINGFVTDSINAYNEAEKASAQLDAVLKSTGHSAGLTADELKGLASGLQALTAFEDDTIVSAEALLLTFTGIGKSVFPQALQSILDVSTAMGQDLKSSVLQIGKALNDPIAGLGALTRVGIQFTDQQKKMIEAFMDTGEVAKAQGVIIQELQRQFGGSAEAYAKTTAGMMTQTMNILGDIQEKFGGALMMGLLPTLEKAKAWIIENQAEIERFATKAREAISSFLAALGKVASWIVENRDTFVTLGKAIVAAFVVAKVHAFGTALSGVSIIAGTTAASIASMLGPLTAVLAAAKFAADYVQRDLVVNSEIDRRQKAAVNDAAAYKKVEQAILAQGVAYSDLDAAIRDHQGYVDGVMMSEMQAFEAMRKNAAHLSGPLKTAVEKYNEALEKLAATKEAGAKPGAGGKTGPTEKELEAIEKQKKEIEGIVEKYYEAQKPLSAQLKAHLDNAQALGMNRDLVEKLLKAYSDEAFLEGLERIPKPFEDAKEREAELAALIKKNLPGLQNEYGKITGEQIKQNSVTASTVSKWEELNAQAEVFDRALGSVFSALDAIGIETGGLQGVLGGALGGLTSGLGMLSKAGDKNNLEGILGKAGGWISIASAGVSLLSGVADLLGLTKTGLDETIESLGRAGVSINENLVKQLEGARKAGKDVGAEMARVTSQIIAQNEVTGQNFGELSRMVRDVFMQFDNHRLSAEEATRAYGAAFVELAKKAADAGKAGGKALSDMIGDARNRGMVSSDMLAWIDTERGKGLAALPKHVEAISKTQDGYNRALRDTMAMYESMVADGKSYTEIAQAMGPAVQAIQGVDAALVKKAQEALAAGNTTLAQQIEQQRIAASRFIAPLLEMQEFVGKNGSVLDALNASKTVFESMANTGILTADSFRDAQLTMMDYYNQLVTNGGTESQSLRAILPMLARQVWYAKEYGYELDEATKKLVEQAEKEGLKLDKAIPAEERMLEIQEQMLEVLKIMAGVVSDDLPAGISETEAAFRRAAEAAGKIKIPGYEGTGENVETGSTKIAGYASGTHGVFVTAPSLWTFAEKEPEMLEWDGSGRIKATPASQLPMARSGSDSRGRGGEVQVIETKIGALNVTLLLPNVRDPYSTQDLIQDVKLNRHGVRDVFEELATRGRGN